MARICLSTIASFCLVCLLAGSSASAQGLLGVPYFDTEFVYYHPKDADINRLDSFIPGVQSNLNVPILGESGALLGLDTFGRFRGLWIDGSDSGVNLGAQAYQYSVGTNLFYNGWQNIRPWIGTGYQHSDSYLQADILGTRLTDHDRTNGFQLTLGVEADVFPMLAVRHSLEFNTEKFTKDDFQNPDYLAEFIISQPMNHWYLRLGAFIDFNGNGGALGGAGVRF